MSTGRHGDRVRVGGAGVVVGTCPAADLPTGGWYGVTQTNGCASNILTCGAACRVGGSCDRIGALAGMAEIQCITGGKQSCPLSVEGDVCAEGIDRTVSVVGARAVGEGVPAREG